MKPKTMTAWMRRAFFFVGLLLSASPAWAQSPYVSSGAALRSELVRDFSPVVSYGYDRARDTLFLRVDLEEGDSLRGVYSGFAIHLDTSADPTIDAFAKGINTEHTFPQSMGADEEPARSDMHHLFPAKDNVNSSRGNHPYDEIPDAETDGWYYRDQSRSTPPPSGVELWAEKDNEHPDPVWEARFEPREDHKGNAARAVFYFALIYEDRASAAFFDVQKDVLLQWHEQDPPDAREIARSAAIASYQGNENPFVLYPELVRRAFFEEGSQTPPAKARYTFDGNTDCPTTDNAPSIVPEGFVFSDFYRSGLECESSPEEFNSAEWGLDSYVGFTMEAEPGNRVIFREGTTLSFKVRRSPMGPTDGQLFMGIGSGDRSQVSSWHLEDADHHTFSVELPHLETEARIEFRFYGLNASHERGTLRFDDVELNFGVLTGIETPEELPNSLTLSPAYPNPFNPSTTLTLEAARTQQVDVAVYDAIGRRVAVLFAGTLRGGERRQLHVELTSAPSGLYFVRAGGAGLSATQAVMLAK